MKLVILFNPTDDKEVYSKFLNMSLDVRELGEKKWVFVDNNNNDMIDFSSFFGFSKVTETKVYLIEMTFDAFNKYELDFLNETSEEIYRKFENNEIEKI